MIGALLERSPGARFAFAGAFFGLQIALVVASTRGPYKDGAFGFRMFPEASTVSIHLLRGVDRPGGGEVWVDVKNGEWAAMTREGDLRSFSWRDRIKNRELAIFDIAFAAPYGVDAVLGHLQSALNDVAKHTEGDLETKVLKARVTVRKNGHEPYVVTLTSGPMLTTTNTASR